MARDTYGEPGEGGGGIGTTTPERPKVYTAIEDGTVIPYVIGTCRVPPILMYQGAFVATTPSWTTVSPITLTNAQDEFNDADFFRVAGYRSAVFALAANPIQGLVSWWRGKEKVTPGLLTKLGVYRAEWNGTLGLTHYTQEDTSAAIVLGTSNPTWTPNAYDPTANGQAWEGVAQLRCLKLALTERGEIPDLAVEVRGFGVTGSGEKDASARDVMEYLLGLLGLSGSSIQLDTGIDGQAASSYARWCTVNDWRVSGIVGKMTVKEAIESLAKSTFSTLVYSEGKVKVIPLGAESYTANSATYTPPTPITIDATDYAELDIDQTADDEVFNTWTVKYADRETNGLYEPRFIQYQDAAHAATSAGVRVTEYESPWLKKRERAFRLAQYLAKESIYQRTIARFTLGQTYALLEPGDLVALDIFGTTRTLRIKSCDHQPGGRIAIEATEVPAGSSTPIDLVPGYASQESGTSWNPGTGSTGGNGLSDIWDDDTLTPPEKPPVVAAYSGFIADQLAGGLIAQAIAQGVGYSAHNSAVNSLASIMSSYGLPYTDLTDAAKVTAWCSKTTSIDGAGLRSAIALCGSERTKLVSALSSSNDTKAGNADTKADQALTLAGTKARVYYQAAAPTGGTYVAGDLWFNTDTTTNCPDSNCKGHLADSNGDPVVGSGVHRGLYWCHRWNGSAWVSAETQALIIASEIAAGAVVASKIAAGSIDATKVATGALTAATIQAGQLKTSNYAEDGSGNPTAGAKLDHTGTALKVADGNFQLGTKTLKASAFYNSFHAAFQFKWTPGASNWGSFPWYHNLKRTAYSGDGYQFDNSLGFWVVGFAWPDAVSSLSNFSVIPVVSLSSNLRSSDIGDVHPVVITYSSTGFSLGFKINGNTWWDFRGNYWSVNVIALGYNIDETGTPQ